MKITVREIAAMTGVSPAAVSLVLNNKEGVSPETRKRITQVLQENNYVLPKKRKKHAGGTVRLIKYAAHGMIVEENQGFIASIIDQIERECFRNQYHLIMTGCNSDNAEETFTMVAGNPLDGVILVGSEMNDSIIRMMHQIKAPIVVIDNPMYYEQVDSVVMANEEIAFDAVSYLSKLGYDQIGYFKSSIRIANFERREIGYQTALDKLPCKAGVSISLTPTLKGAYEDMKAYLQHSSDLLSAAFFADNDTIALGAMKALQEAGFRIPEDISIIGIDDIPFSAINTPSLTTMRISRSTIGKMAVDILLKRIKNNKSPYFHMQITGQLVERNSTGKKFETERV